MTKTGIGSNSGAAVQQLTEKDKKLIATALTTGDEILNRIAAERETLKGLVESIYDATGVEKKLIRRMIKTRHKASYLDDVAEDKEFSTLYDEVEKLSVTKPL